jgi:error-prone DNA polymerase
MPYTELQVTSNFSFLRGASHPEEMVQQARALGYSAMAITDRNTFAGIVRAHVEAKKAGVRLIAGCYLHLLDGPGLLAYPTNLNGYAKICELLTTGNMRAEKGDCHLNMNDIAALEGDVIGVVQPPYLMPDIATAGHGFLDQLLAYRRVFGENLYLAAQRRYRGDDAKYLHRLSMISRDTRVPLVATNDVYYHEPLRRQLQDLLTCIREKCTIHTAGFRLYPNAERYLKSEDEMHRLFRQYPDAIDNTGVIAEACRFSLDELKYVYPEELTPAGRSPQEELTRLVWEGAHDFYGETIPEKTIKSIHHELQFIEQMNYPAYFLTVHDIVRFARSQGILCQGRGSAANSTVCFCLGITSVNPAKFDLLFERFLSTARNEPPDIDVDFEHERREEVIQYIYNKYGRDRAAIVATVTQQHHKGAIRDVAKAMGLSVDTINKLSGSFSHYGSGGIDGKSKAEELGMNKGDPYLAKVFELTNQYIGFPRQLGQHTGGFVISQHKLSHLCPLMNARMENRTSLEWNKDDIESLGFLKIDVLALGMLTCIRKAFVLAKQHYGKDMTLANIPQDDPAVYEMISNADTIGVFQIESRAQMSMLPRLKPRTFYDLVIEVAIVRPGPIQGDMVHPYLRRRNGEEPVDYPSKELEEILGRTLGVPLFQEQAMKVAIVAADFTPTEADQLRRCMATFKAKGMVSYFEKKLINGMTRKGYTLEYARRIYRQLEGFGSYGFPESHAASFALLVYVSAWLKCHYPDVFACALLNSLPMGFYQPAQIVIDAQKHEVEVLPVDVNLSDWDNKMEEISGRYFSVRLGFRHIKGLQEQDAFILLKARSLHFPDIFSVCETGISHTALERLADADAFRSVGLDRRQALWHISVRDKPEAMFTGQRLKDTEEEGVSLPIMPLSEHVLHDYAATSLSLKAHPVSFLREKLDLLRVIPTRHLATTRNGEPVKVAGLVLVRQRPETANGVWFITIEDETGIANLVVFKNVSEQHKKQIVQARLLLVEGKLQVEGGVIHVMAKACHDISKMLTGLVARQVSKVSLPLFSRSDEVMHPKPPGKNIDPGQEVIPAGRNFR